MFGGSSGDDLGPVRRAWPSGGGEADRRRSRSLTAWQRAGRLRIMDYAHLITIEPGKRSGQPCIRGLRMTVRDVLEYLAGGMAVEDILADFPDLTAEDIRACLAFAADRERRLWVVPVA